MENDLLESCKKLLTKGYTGVVVSDCNGLPVFGKRPCLSCPSCSRASDLDALSSLFCCLLISCIAAAKGTCVSNSLGASGFSSSLVRYIFVGFTVC